jgi:23S rRNA pseudouridine1911/1915/1917 synthase
VKPQYFSALVTEALHKTRLDKALLVLFDLNYSRSQYTKLIVNKGVMVDGELVSRAGYKVECGQKLSLVIPAIEYPESGSVLEPHVIYSDDDIVVIDKPAGLPMHPNTLADTQPSLSTWLVREFGEGLPICGGEERPGIVHRLDKYTSGVCVAARTENAFKGLQMQFAERKVQKEYHAICAGTPRFNSDWIDRRLRPHPQKPMRVATTNLEGEGTREALTYWEVIKYFPDFCLLKIQPKTGRKHQIRVHLSSADLPILGDFFYGTNIKLPNSWPENISLRPFLHAFSLEFLHPVTSAPLQYDTQYPEDMDKALKFLAS